MSALGVLVIVAFGLVVVQLGLFVLGLCAGDDEGAFSIAGFAALPVALVVIAAFILALVQSCDPAEPVRAPVAAESPPR